MRVWRLSLFGAIAASTALAADYFVDQSGANGAFTTVQAAVDAVAGQSELNRANIFIAPGVYPEFVFVSQPFVSLIGTGDSANDVRIVFARAKDGVDDGDWGQVLSILPSATAFMARNVTIENTSADAATLHALAVQSAADRTVFDNVRILGSRDTLLVDYASRQYFRSSLITGTADFIFGDATAVFDRCTIVSKDAGWIAAPSTAESTAIGFVFLDSSLLATGAAVTQSDNEDAQRGSVFLARPWLWWEGRKPSATFIRTRMGAHIIPQGWDAWGIEDAPDGDPDSDRDRRTRFAEFGSMNLAGQPLDDANGDGTPDLRARWADVLTDQQAANYTLEHIFGPPDFWNAATQPDAADMPYESQGAPWNETGQLALLPQKSGARARPLNLSTRLRTETGENVAIAGFILRGTTSKEILVRALGPSLSQTGIEDALPNPTLALRDANGALVKFNGNWKHSQADEIAATGLAPEDDLESALVASLPPGGYTALLKGYMGGTGVTLAEIYDIDPTADAELANISTRGVVGSGDDVMIAGFILGGGEGTSKVLIRGIGPSLAQSGVAQPLADPVLTLHDGDGNVITSNDNWQDSQPAEIGATQIAPSDPHESAMAVTLPAGAYTAVLSGKESSGVALIEVYALE